VTKSVANLRKLFTAISYDIHKKLEHLFLALPQNIRLGWKGLPGTNALAY